MPNRLKDKAVGTNGVVKVLLTNRMSRTTRAPRLEPPDAEETYSARTQRKVVKPTEGGPTPMSDYINRISGVNKIPQNLLQHDHPYARPPGWRAENYLATPRRNLYLPNPNRPKVDDDADDTEELDVDSVSEEVPVPYLSQLNNENPSASNLGSDGDDYQDNEETSDSGDETIHWSEKISRVGWTSQQLRVFPRVVQLIEDVQLPHLSFKGHPKQALLISGSIRTIAAKFDRLLASVSWDKLFTQWLHGLFMEKLPRDQMSHYVELLTALKARVHGLLDRMIVAPSHTGRSTLPKEFEQPTINLAPKVDRVAEALSAEPFTKLPQGPVFVIIPNSMDAEKSVRFSAMVIQLRQMAQVYVVDFKPGVTILHHVVEHMMTETRAKILQVRSDYPTRGIFLLGWNVGAAIACLVSQLEPVRAVICIGFPLLTLDGPRGTPNDPVLDMTCPVLFITGQLANVSRTDLLEEMRIRMKVPSQLVMFGSCDDHIVMSRTAATALRVTQTMIDRSLLLEIHSFVGGTLTEIPLPPPRVVQPPVERRAIPVKRKFCIAQVMDSPSPPVKKLKAPTINPAALALVKGRLKLTSPVKQRKPRISPAQKLMLDSAKYAAELPPDYAAKLQQASTSAQTEPRVWTPTTTSTTVPIVTQTPAPVQARFPVKFGNVQSIAPQASRVAQSTGISDINLKGSTQAKPLNIPGLVISSSTAKNYKRVAEGTTKMVQISSNPQMHISHHPRNVQTVSSILISPKSGSSKPIQVFTGPTTATNAMLANHMQSVASMSIMARPPKMGRFLTPTTKPAELGKVTVITTKPQFMSRSKSGNVVIMSDDMKGREKVLADSGHDTLVVYPVMYPVDDANCNVGSADESSHINVPMSLNDEMLTPDAILKLPVIFAKDGENIFDLPVGMQKSSNDCSFMIPLDGPCNVGTETSSSTNIIVVSPDNSSRNIKPAIKAPKKYTRRASLVPPVKYTKVILANSKKVQPSTGLSETSPMMSVLKEDNLIDEFDVILKKINK